MALNYRKDVLAEDGFSEKDVPETYEQLEQIARKLRNPAKKQFGAHPRPLHLASSPRTRTCRCCGPCRGTVTDDKGRLDVSSPEARQTFETLKRWYTSGLMPKGALTPYQSADDFRAKIAVFFPNWQSRGFWAIREMKDGEKHIGIGPAPGSKRTGALLAHYIGVIPKASPVAREAARVLLEAFCYDLQPGVGKAGKMIVINYPYQRQRPGYQPAPVPRRSPRFARWSTRSTACPRGCSPCAPPWTRATASPTR